MQIFYKDQLGFLIKGDTVSVALALATTQIGGEEIVVTASADHNYKAKKGQAVFDWPGEYEAKGVFAQVIPLGSSQTARTVKLMIDDVAIAHLDLSEKLSEAEEERIGNVDILLVATGKASRATAKDIQNAIEAIDPRIVIPMNFAAGEEIDFAKLLGFGETAAEDSLKIKKANLPIDRMELKIMKINK